MKYKFLIFFLSLIYIPCFSQHNAWMDTYVYNVQLPKEINNKAGVYITILYNDEPLLSTKQWIGSNERNIATEFTYHEKATSVLNNVKLPIALPAKTYSWLINKKMVDEMELYPNRFKMEVIATGKPIKNYELPQQFDFINDYILDIYTLKSMNKDARNTVFSGSNHILNVAHKKSKSIPIKEVVKKENDTIISFSVQDDGIPKWLSIVDAEYKPNNSYNRTTEILEYTGYWYNQKLYINRKKQKGDFPMQCYVKYILTDLQGNTCSCQIGAGAFSTGNCREIIKTKKVKVEVWINP